MNLSLKDVLPVVVPVLIIAFGVFIGPALTTKRRLQQELSSDAEMLDQVPDAAQEELRREIGRRTHILVSIYRHPPLTLADILAILGVCVLTGASVWNLLVYEQDDIWEPVSFFWPLVFAGLCWWAFFKPWNERAGRRLRYLADHLGNAEAEAFARSLRVAWYSATLIGAAVIAVPPIALLFIMSDKKDLSSSVAVLASTGILMASFYLVVGGAMSMEWSRRITHSYMFEAQIVATSGEGKPEPAVSLSQRPPSVVMPVGRFIGALTVMVAVAYRRLRRGGGAR